MKRKVGRILILISFLIIFITPFVFDIIYEIINWNNDVSKNVKVPIAISRFVLHITSGLFLLFISTYHIHILKKVLNIKSNYFSDNDIDKAIKLITKYSNHFVSIYLEEIILVILGDMYLRKGDYNQSISIYKKVKETYALRSLDFDAKFVSLYYLVLLNYLIQDNTNYNNYLNEICNIIDKENKKKRKKNKLSDYKSQIDVINDLKNNDIKHLKDSIVIECDGDPNKDRFVEEISA